MTTPTWQAPTSGQPPLAAHVNQLLGTHAITVLYTGVQRSAQTAAGSGNVKSNGLYLAQRFTTAASQTAIGYVMAQTVSTASSGANLAPLTLGLYANSGSAPSGSPLVTVAAPAEYVINAPTWVVFPLPATVSPSTTYWLVTSAVGNATYYYGWDKSTQTSGASTSTNGTTWTAQSYGLLYQVFDQTVTGSQVCTWEDGGARWTWTGYTSGQPTQIAEYTAGQTSAGYLQSYRTLSYSGQNVTGVT